MEEKVEKVGIAWRVPAEVRDKLVERFGSVSSKVVPETVMSVFFDLYPKAKQRNEELEAEIETLRAAAGTFAENAEQQVKINELEDSLKLVNEEVENYKQQVLKLNSLLEEKVTLIKELTASADDPNIISIRVENEIIKNLLDAVREHLSEKYDRDVTFYEIFVKSTIMYNVEKRCDWFYPPLKDSKIEEITGKSIRDWKHFLSNKEK